MLCQAKLLCNGSSGVQFAAMALAVVKGQADDAVALLKGKARAAAVAESKPPERSAMAVR